MVESTIDLFFLVLPGIQLFSERLLQHIIVTFSLEPIWVRETKGEGVADVAKVDTAIRKFVNNLPISKGVEVLFIIAIQRTDDYLTIMFIKLATAFSCNTYILLSTQYFLHLMFAVLPPNIIDFEWIAITPMIWRRCFQQLQLKSRFEHLKVEDTR